MRRWRGRGDFAKVDFYTRGTFYFLLWTMVASQVAFSVTRPVRNSGAPAALIAASCLLAVAQGVAVTGLVSRWIDVYLGKAQLGWRPVALGAGLMVADVTVSVALWSVVGLREEPVGTSALAAAAAPFLMAHCLVVRKRVSVAVQAGALALVCGAVALTGEDAGMVWACAISVVGLCGWFAVTVRCSAWHLGVMWKIDQARDVQARLAVAEERLRFGRDLHDVMGRNLAVIALKSELAVQLARRGRAEASVEQMVEVQRLAQESQREVRDVVRGYREADLRVELAGAQGVLEAAGIVCTVSGDVAELPVAVQSALGWVVREAATNVLRHGDAGRCAIGVDVVGSAVTLTVENDGACADPGGSGSGLAGLRERLAVLEGTLEAGALDGGRFLLTARVPVEVSQTKPLRRLRSGVRGGAPRNRTRTKFAGGAS
ncbi:sensor histidine kinase [Streptomyces beijiangensis]|uniref:Sensor histidine kinase n=2 Tax=Streptomyces beijiangensis TaxID=163361 RepID=A0A939FD66_9ACTN|nr:histidine kinase [Streptomyces beijiangensis]MBO0515858.1 sensor histidine kinase [Streptomyces beijiangensis]